MGFVTGEEGLRSEIGKGLPTVVVAGVSGAFKSWSGLEFEEELAEKFGVGSRSRELGSDLGEDMVENNQSVSDIRKKYEKKLATHHGNFVLQFMLKFMGIVGVSVAFAFDYKVQQLAFNFRGIISSCFEPYLAVYVELEEKTLMEHLEKLVQEETWEIEEGSQTNILSSSMQEDLKEVQCFDEKSDIVQFVQGALSNSPVKA
ncbi:vacuolar protein sorting-associated protein 53 a [Phtheirospermum japonicum]|uniref:Vacuolar protein sorting-associated protein 53 a n=1 Tax=Phtheirospermum japonicum TaxID=374723 RepID=A0A830CAQ7_9LAMI|nr:vacuolar protein sorting-associated protein 53 a [Phtheirospermum japonicum]